MRLTRVQSQAIEAVGYEPSRRVLVVRFLSGETYEYFDVDRALFEGLLAAQHPWTQHGDEVKQHRFRHLS